MPKLTEERRSVNGFLSGVCFSYFCNPPATLDVQKFRTARIVLYLEKKFFHVPRATGLQKPDPRETHR